MKTRNTILRKTALAAAVVLLVGGVSTMNDPILSGTGYGWISSAYAAEDGGGKGSGGHQGAMGEGRGGQGAKGAGGQGHRGGKSVKDVLAEDDDGDSDSDRPEWAGVAGGEGRPGGGGNPQPGDTKGDDYGDMIMVVRDPVTGVPLDVNGLPTYEVAEMLVCTDADCTYLDKDSWVAKVDGEIPAGVTPIEVDLGRSSLVRSPDAVIESRLDEALALIKSADSISQDTAGRIVVTVDGEEKTIDSPLENLALYIDLMQGLISDETTATEAALAAAGLANLDTAASLLAGVHDKTGDITLDYVMYMDYFAGVSADFTGFTYDRDYPDNYTYWWTPDGVVDPVSVELNINAYLQAINGDLPLDSDYAALYAAAADDAVEVIELIHTQVVVGDQLPGSL